MRNRPILGTAGLVLVTATLIASSSQRLVVVTPSLAAQIGISHSITEPRDGKGMRFPDPRSVGLPENARVNVAMFEGLMLTSDQARAVVAVTESFKKERESRGEPKSGRGWTPEMKALFAPIIERQRLAYRNILTAEQRPQFDVNTHRILVAWRSRSAASADASEGR
jgi:hypothetical protein